jgi:hypothetical protein
MQCYKLNPLRRWTCFHRFPLQVRIWARRCVTTYLFTRLQLLWICQSRDSRPWQLRLDHSMLMKTRRSEFCANIEKCCGGRDGGHADLFQSCLVLPVLLTMWVIKNLECGVLHCLCILYALCYLYQRLFLATWHLTLKERMSYNGSAKLNMFLWCRSFQALEWIRPWRCFHVQISKFNSSKVSCFQQW